MHSRFLQSSFQSPVSTGAPVASNSLQSVFPIPYELNFWNDALIDGGYSIDTTEGDYWITSVMKSAL